MRTPFLLFLIAVVACASSTLAQSPEQSPYFSRANSFGFFGAYANDSSHILLGDAENRRILNFGASYSRRLWIGRVANWQYDAEVLPVALESDPVLHDVVTYTSPSPGVLIGNSVLLYACHPSSGKNTQTIGGVVYSYSYVDTCTRRWTIGEGFSPVGFQWNFLPRRKLQPFLEAHGGYMYSTRPIPVPTAGSFNFTFDFGGGVELYRSKTRSTTSSVRAGIRYHHISNHDTGNSNPGIDNAVVQLTYAFGR